MSEPEKPTPGVKGDTSTNAPAPSPSNGPGPSSLAQAPNSRGAVPGPSVGGGIPKPGK